MAIFAAIIMVARIFKSITIILLLLCVILMSFSKIFIVLSFYANRTEIASTYCINKGKPSLQCDGKCFLMRMLKKETQREKDVHEYFSKTPVFFCHHYFPTILPKIFTPKSERSVGKARSTLFIKFDFFHEILRPPIFFISLILPDYPLFLR